MNAVSKTAELCIPTSLNATLEDVARKTGRSKSYHARKALESFPEDIEDRELLLAAIEESRGKETTSLEDIVKELGLQDAVYGPRKKAH